MSVLVENLKDLDLDEELVVVTFDDIEEFFLNNEKVMGTDEEVQKLTLLKLRRLLGYHRAYREDEELGEYLLMDKKSLLSSIVFEALSVMERAEEENNAEEEED